MIPAQLQQMNGLSRCGTRYSTLYGRICKSKTGWSPGARSITQFQIKNERLEMRKSMGALRELSSGVDHESQAAEDRSGIAQTLLALARTLDSHVERYDADVLPSILRALSHQ